MAVEDTPAVQPDAESSDDLNDLALREFLKLVHSEKSLGAEWKSAILSLAADGIPKDVSPLQELVDGGIDVEIEDA
jgi:hypothetical protein